MEIELAGPDRLDLVHIGKVPAAGLGVVHAIEREGKRARKEFQQLADEQRAHVRCRSVGGGLQSGQLAREKLLAKLAAKLALAKAGDFVGRLRLELRDGQRISAFIQGHEGHVSGQQSLRSAGRRQPVRHRYRDSDARTRGVSNRGGHRDPLANADRLAQLHSIDGGGHHRVPRVAGGGKYADHVHPLEDLARAQKSPLIRNVGRNPLVQVSFRPGSGFCGCRGELFFPPGGEVRSVEAHPPSVSKLGSVGKNEDRAAGGRASVVCHERL